MKRIFLAITVFLLAHSLFAQNSTKDSTAKTGKVYFLRATGMSTSMKRFFAFIDDELVCKLDEKTYSIHALKPGKHVFSVQFGGKKSKQKNKQIDITIEAGKLYYIQMAVQQDIWTANINCQEITENSAKKMMTDLREEKKCDND
ncbi:MAG: DUF2846 domain-containing protein [Chitinophagaceae bacterium]